MNALETFEFQVESRSTLLTPWYLMLRCIRAEDIGVYTSQWKVIVNEIIYKYICRDLAI